MTRREKLLSTLTDNQLWNAICEAHLRCKTCPFLEIDICNTVINGEKIKAWLDEEVEE